MEDQPTDSGDLTTDVSAVSRRHRMPRGKQRVRVTPGPEEIAEAADSPDDEPVTATEASETTHAVADEVSSPRRRRWPRRRRTTSEAPADETTVDETDLERTIDERAETTVDDTARADETTVDDDVAQTDENVESLPEETVLVPHRPAGKRLKIAAAAAATVFVAAGAFAGATFQPYLADLALVRVKEDVAETAAKAITTLWTYTPEDMDSLPNRAARYLAGDFATEYRNYIDAIVATNKQAQVTNDTEVMGTAVESLNAEEATALVYTNSVATSPVTKNIPSLRYLAYRLTLQRDGSDWLINQMTAVTQLDLTPQL